MCSERIARHCICCGGSDLKTSPAVLMPFVAKRVFGHEPVMITSEWGIRDLQLGMAYSICNSMQCGSCGVMFLDLRFSELEMSKLYEHYRDEEYTRLRDLYEPGYRATSEFYSGRSSYIGTIEAFLSPRVSATQVILDWGGDDGVNTPLKSTARTVHIYDISNKPALPGATAVDMATVRSTNYDLIVCSQVLEHVPFPKALLGEIVSVMRPATQLYLEVPYEALMRTHAGSKEIHKAKRHWHEHINFFSEESLLSMLDQAGLQLLEMRALPISLGWRDGCVISILCRRA